MKIEKEKVVDEILRRIEGKLDEILKKDKIVVDNVEVQFIRKDKEFYRKILTILLLYFTFYKCRVRKFFYEKKILPQELLKSKFNVFDEEFVKNYKLKGQVVLLPYLPNELKKVIVELAKDKILFYELLEEVEKHVNIDELSKVLNKYRIEDLAKEIGEVLRLSKEIVMEILSVSSLKQKKKITCAGSFYVPSSNKKFSRVWEINIKLSDKIDLQKIYLVVPVDLLILCLLSGKEDYFYPILIAKCIGFVDLGDKKYYIFYNEKGHILSIVPKEFVVSVCDEDNCKEYLEIKEEWEDFVENKENFVKKEEKLNNLTLTLYYHKDFLNEREKILEEISKELSTYNLFYDLLKNENINKILEEFVDYFLSSLDKINVKTIYDRLDEILDEIIEILNVKEFPLTIGTLFADIMLWVSKYVEYRYKDVRFTEKIYLRPEKPKLGKDYVFIPIAWMFSRLLYCLDENKDEEIKGSVIGKCVAFFFYKDPIFANDREIPFFVFKERNSENYFIIPIYFVVSVYSSENVEKW